jgi:hypothetical protein
VPLCVALCLGPLSCSSTDEDVDDASASAVEITKLLDGRRSLLLRWTNPLTDTPYVATLEETQGQVDPSARPHRVTELQPPAAGIEWMFPLLTPDVDVLLDSGRLIPHPDRRVTATMLELIEGARPEVAGAVGGLERHARLESRALVMVKAAAVPALSEEVRDQLVTIATGGLKGSLLGPGPGNRPAGGSRSTALFQVLGALALRKDLTPKQADRLAGKVPDVKNDERERTLLVQLVKQTPASAEALIESVEELDTDDAKPRYRRDVLLGLTGRPSLTPSDASQVAEACPMIEADDYEVEVLLAALSRGASASSLIKAQTRLDSSATAPDKRARVLLGLSRRKDTTPDEADEVAEAAPGIDDDKREATLLLDLIERQLAATDPLLDAVSEIDDSDDEVALRTKVVNALVASRGRESQEADRLARRARVIEDDGEQAAVLLTLIAKDAVSAEAVCEGVEHMGGGAAQQKREVLLKLVNLHGKETDYADTIAACAQEIDADRLEAEVLGALLAERAVSTDALVDAIDELDTDDAAPALRRQLLLTLISQRGDDDDDAEAIAGAIPGIDADGYEREVLVALIARSAVEVADVIDAVAEIGGEHRSTLRADVLRILASGYARGGEAGEVAEAVPGIEDDRLEERILVLLAASDAPVDAVLEAAEDIDESHDSDLTTPLRRVAVLLALSRRSRLSSGDAADIAEACADLDNDRLEADVLVSLAGRATDDALNDALESIDETSQRLRVQRAIDRVGE